MSNKQMKRVRKLKRIFGYTPMMYTTMKKIVRGFDSEKREHFATEVDVMIDRKIPKKPVFPDLEAKNVTAK